MTSSGPALDALLRHLIEAPPDILPPLDAPGGTAPARSGPGRTGTVNITAVVHDLVEMLFPSGPPDTFDRRELDRFDSLQRSDPSGRTAACALLCAWLLRDPWFGGGAEPAFSQEQVWSVFTNVAPTLAEGNSAATWFGEARAREELARTVLSQLDLRPSGETTAQAEDRLTRISSAQRRRVLAAAREAELRAKEVREALAAKAAQESADKYTRE